MGLYVFSVGRELGVFVGDTGVVADGFSGGHGAFLGSVGVFFECACGGENLFCSCP